MKSLTRIRFSLRTLLLITVLVAILAAEFTRRLWRYQDRKTAILTLASYGFRFTKDASQIKRGDVDPRGLPPFGWLDLLLFGDEVKAPCYKAEFNVQEYFAALEKQPLPEFAKLLQHFPEIEVLNVTESRKRLPWTPAVVVSVQQLLSAVAERPHLLDFHLDALPTDLGSEWMTKIPEQNRLQFFNWSFYALPPETISQLMKRAPAINNIRVSLSDLNEDLVRRWNQNPSWRFNEQGKAKGEFSCTIELTPENIRNVEHYLNQVQVNLHLCLDQSKEEFPDSRFELDGSGIASVICPDFREIKLRNLPNCIYVMLSYKTENIEVINCPRIPAEILKEIQDRIDGKARSKRPGRRLSKPEISP